MNHPLLRPFDLNSVHRDGRLYVFLGTHGSGKSTLMFYLTRVLCHQLGIHDWVGFSETENGNNALKTVLTKSHIYPRAPTEDDISYFIEIKDKEYRIYEKKIKENALAEGEGIRNLGIIIDDCGSRAEIFRNSAIMERLVNNQRHYRIWIFMVVQTFKQLQPKIREQIDYLFICKWEEGADTLYKEVFKNRLGITERINLARREYDRLNYYKKQYIQTGSALVVDKAQVGYAEYLTYFEWPSKSSPNYPRYFLGDESFVQSGLETQEDETETIEDLEDAMRRMGHSRFVK